MNNLLKEKSAIGVVICRMQVPYLTDSHKSIINTVLDRHNRVVLLVGVNSDGCTSRNPYPFEFRKQMIELAFDNVIIIPIPDLNDNKLWVDMVDMMVSTFLSRDEQAILYGSRDSFIHYYEKDNGKFTCIELAPKDLDSGTELRDLESIELPKYSVDTAKAILWTLRQTKIL